MYRIYRSVQDDKSVRKLTDNKKQESVIENEIKNLLEFGVIQEVEPIEGQFISPIFVRPKKNSNGEYRMILNLKELNTYVEYHHFKMDIFETKREYSAFKPSIKFE